jgi:predicted amidophosphoribosyltransferase
MALINCPECTKEISDKVKSCPNCGYPFDTDNKLEIKINKTK